MFQKAEVAEDVLHFTTERESDEMGSGSGAIALLKVQDPIFRIECKPPAQFNPYATPKRPRVIASGIVQRLLFGKQIPAAKVSGKSVGLQSTQF